jgi:hypothetical protein
MTIELAVQPVTLRPDVVMTVTKEGAVLLDLESKYFFSVNGAASAILQLVEQGATAEEVVAGCRRLGMPESGAGAVEAFLARLWDEGLVEACEWSEPAGDVKLSGSWQAPTIEKHREPLHRIMASAFDPSIPLAE